MKTPLNMLEFVRLTQLWLDGRATAEETEMHWRMVVEHVECARELAAAARFEALLEQRLSEASEEAKGAGVLAAVTVRGREEMRVTNWGRVVKPMLKIAAVIVVGGLLWWIVGRESGEGGSMQQVAGRRMGGPEMKREVEVPAEVEVVPQVVPAVVVAGVTEWTVDSLRTWLDGYFLRGVDLNQVTLNEALGRLQADMMAVNFQGADVVGRLRVTVSADAAGRRVSLKSGAISFLKAIQALASQAGCEVEVGDLLLAVESKAQPYPQPTARHDLREVLAGRFDVNGVADADRPELMAKVWADAVAQGFVVAEAMGKGPVRLTQGQLETLRGLADARGQIDQLPAQEYQLRMVAGGGYGPGRVLDAGEVKQLLAQPASESLVKVVVVKPGQRVAVDRDGMSAAELEILPVGHGFEVGLWVGSAPSGLVPAGGINLAGGGRVGDAAGQLNSNVALASAPIMVATGQVAGGQGAVMDLAGGAVLMDMPLSTRTASTLQGMGSVSSMTGSASEGQVLLLPVNPPQGSPP